MCSSDLQLTYSDVEADALSSIGSSSDSALAASSSEDIVGAAGLTDSSTKSATPISTKLTVSDTHYDKSATQFKVTLKDKSGKALANQKISLKVNKKSYTAYTNANGVASFKTERLTAGTYTVALTYGGSSDYSSSSLSKKVKVNKDETTIDAKSKRYIHTNKKGSFTVTLKSKHNALLKNKKITFTYNGKKVTSKTNAKGKATITIPVLAKGTYKLEFKYGGSANYYAKSGSAKLVVSDATTKLTSSIKVVTYKDGSKFKVKLTNAKGKALANKNVKIKLNGKTVTYKTNKNGNVYAPLKNIKPGNYLVKYSYLTKEHKSFSSGSNRVII